MACMRSEARLCQHTTAVQQGGRVTLVACGGRHAWYGVWRLFWSPLSDPRISPPTHISISHIHIDITSNLMPAQASRRRRCRSRNSVRAWRAPSRRRSARRRLVRTRRPAGSLACRCGRCDRAAGGGCELVASARPSSCLSSAMWACLGERPRRGQSLWLGFGVQYGKRTCVGVHDASMGPGRVCLEGEAALCL